MVTQFFQDLKLEFKGYNQKKLMQDVMAGLTVTAVALPLALAFGVSSGANAASGIISAIIAGIVMGGMAGASYQVSGPTGTMTAILFLLSIKYGVEGIFITGFLGGIFLLIAAIFHFGRFVSFIPSPVITGFTSGIAIIIALGQVDNFLGTTTQGGFSPNLYSIMFGMLVIIIMIFWPKKWNAKIPASLAGLIIALAINWVIDFPVNEVGEIPRTLLAENRLTLSTFSSNNIINFISPAISIATLCMIESLLCGSSAGKIKNEKLNADMELVAQGIGNILIPFFGGIPASAVLARTSVALKSGGQTRLVSIIQSVGLLFSMFLLGPFISKIPMAALAGVLMVTAWRMNEWNEIKYIFNRKFATSIIEFVVTMIATVMFDLTIAILLGVSIAILLFVTRNCDLKIDVSNVDLKRMQGYDISADYTYTKLVYLTGPMFFVTKDKLIESLGQINNANSIIFSMRAVTSIDQSAVSAFKEAIIKFVQDDVDILFCGVQPDVKTMFDRSGLTAKVSEDNFYWDAVGAIKSLECLEQLNASK